MKKEVLFVEDEPLALAWLKLTLRDMESVWDMKFAKSKSDALSLIEEARFDVVVSGLSSDNKGDLLEEVYKRYPKTVRFLLSRNFDHEKAIESARAAHQVLSKPCNPVILKEAIARMVAMEYWLRNESVARLVSRMTVVPSLPSIYTELSAALKSSNSSMEQIGEIISRDVGMTAKILQLVNSAFFGLRRRVTDPADAAVFIGIETLRSLFLALHVFNAFKQEGLKNFSLEEFSSHSFATGISARKIAELEGVGPKIREDALLAGMMHDLGKLVVAANQPALYDRAVELAREKKISLAKAENEVMGASHAEIGAYLLGLWGLPAEIVEAVAFHHNPGGAQQKAFSALTAVYVANHLQHQNASGSHDSGELDEAYLEKLGIKSRYPMWVRAIHSFPK